MPAAVFDFAAIAARLRKDDFYAPAPKAKLEAYYQCRDCYTVFESESITDGATYCPNCGLFNRCYFP